MSDEKDSSSSAVAEPKVRRKVARPNQRPKQPPLYHVILLNDDDHSYEYVIEMLCVLFAHSEEKAFQMAKEVDENDRVIVLTTHKEHAELKRDQIHAYGADERVATCAGSMSAIIEPVPE